MCHFKCLNILFSLGNKYEFFCCATKITMLNKWFKVIGNSSPMMESITCSSSDQSVPPNVDDTSERATLEKLIDSSPVNAPFRKKAITSIERTRKLSILLKHQHYLVSFFFNSFFFLSLRELYVTRNSSHTHTKKLCVSGSVLWRINCICIYE